MEYTLYKCKNCGYITSDCEDANDCFCGYKSNAIEIKVREIQENET